MTGSRGGQPGAALQGQVMLLSMQAPLQQTVLGGHEQQSVVRMQDAWDTQISIPVGQEQEPPWQVCPL